MIPKYPFLLLNPGELETQVNTTESFFVWFARDLDPSERKPVMKGCPYPVNMVRHWGKNYVHFGSRNLGYQPDIVKTYEKESNTKLDAIVDGAARAYRSSGILPEDDEPRVNRSGALARYERVMAKGLRVGYPRFVAAFDAWLLKAHSIVPVAFALGPHQTAKSDDWSDWSQANLAGALEVYLRTRTAAFDADTASKERYAHSMVLQTILSQLPGGELRVDQIEPLLTDLDLVFECDGIHTAFGRFDFNEGRMTAQVKLLHKVLSVDAGHRTTWLRRLGAYTQLAYYAFEPTESEPALLGLEDAVQYIEEQVARFPPNRDRILLGMLLSCIAKTITKPRATPSPSPADYALAAQLLAIATNFSHQTSNDGEYWCTRIEYLHRAALTTERDDTIRRAQERFAQDPYNMGQLLERLGALGLDQRNEHS
jgi:hypothetical protein